MTQHHFLLDINMPQNINVILPDPTITPVVLFGEYNTKCSFSNLTTAGRRHKFSPNINLSVSGLAFSLVTLYF